MSLLAHAIHYSPLYFGLSLRSVSTSTALQTRSWRVSQGLPVHKTAEGLLVDGPDYTFLDGRPTPLLAKQKLRMLKQREFARTIVELNSELDFAIQREKQIHMQAQQEREAYVQNKLKPKGQLSKK